MKRISRRTFGLGVGASVLAGSWLRGLNGVAHAAETPSAKRLVIFFSPNGTIHNHWRPQGSGTNFTLPAGSILEPLAAHAQGIAVLDGLDFYGTSNHEGGMSHMLTGGGTLGDVGEGASVDQFVAKQIGTGLINGRAVLTLRFIAALNQPEPQEKIMIHGQPSFEMLIPGGIHGDISTSAVLINTIAPVLNAQPGLNTMVSIPAPTHR